MSSACSRCQSLWTKPARASCDMLRLPSGLNMNSLIVCTGACASHSCICTDLDALEIASEIEVSTSSPRALCQDTVGSRLKSTNCRKRARRRAAAGKDLHNPAKSRLGSNACSSLYSGVSPTALDKGAVTNKFSPKKGQVARSKSNIMSFNWVSNAMREPSIKYCMRSARGRVWIKMLPACRSLCISRQYCIAYSAMNSCSATL